eukprot:5397124-Pyramimonas_sp.AAC.1
MRNTPKGPEATHGIPGLPKSAQAGPTLCLEAGRVAAHPGPQAFRFQNGIPRKRNATRLDGSQKSSRLISPDVQQRVLLTQ